MLLELMRRAPDYQTGAQALAHGLALSGSNRFVPTFPWFERLTHLVLREYLLRAIVAKPSDDSANNPPPLMAPNEPEQSSSGPEHPPSEPEQSSSGPEQSPSEPEQPSSGPEQSPSEPE
jgi:hypothetical protein